MPVDIKTILAEVEAESTAAKAEIVTLQAENAKKDATIASLQAQVGNVSDEDAASIRSALADLKASYTPATPAPPPAPQPAPAPPTN